MTHTSTHKGSSLECSLEVVQTVATYAKSATWVGMIAVVVGGIAISVNAPEALAMTRPFLASIPAHKVITIAGGFTALPWAVEVIAWALDDTLHQTWVAAMTTTAMAISWLTVVPKATDSAVAAISISTLEEAFTLHALLLTLGGAAVHSTCQLALIWEQCDFPELRSLEDNILIHQSDDWGNA